MSFGTTRSRSPSFLPPTGSPATLCGNGVCELTHLAIGETCGNCPADCGPCQTVDDVSSCLEQGVFSLTIDDGPSLVTPQLLTNLAAQNVKASFFLLGNNMDTYPGTVTAEFQAQHSLASHTYSHPALTTISTEEVVKWKGDAFPMAVGRCPFGSLSFSISCSEFDGPGLKPTV